METENKKTLSSNVLSGFDIDESPGAPPISEQLAVALRQNSTRVIDLFREWDTDGDGEVSRAEFHKAMPALGLEVGASRGSNPRVRCECRWPL